MPVYHLDYESFSEADLNNWGAYRYASHHSTEILMFSIGKDEERPLVWDVLDSFGENKRALAMLREAIRSGALIYAHNSQFEAALSKYLFKKTFGFEPPKLTQWRCTAAMCRRAAIPSSLAGAGEFLGLDITKDKAGKALISKFSIPRKPTKADPRTRIHPAEDQNAFREFGEYCRQDVESERAIHKTLKAFELEGTVLDSFQFDQKMNDFGIPVNVEGLKRINIMIDDYSDRMACKFKAKTGLNPTQRDKALEWLRDRGYPYQNLQAENVDEVLNNGPNGWETRYLERERELEGLEIEKPPAKFTAPKLQPVEMTEEAFEALRLRSLVSYAAVKKVPTMLNAACEDGRVRGALLWSGAERTHRWSGRIIQPQNFRRPRFKGTEQAYKMLCEGVDIETIEMLFGPFLEVVASCIRHFIHDPDGELLQADFSSVEARGAPWLCGAEKTLQLFRDNVPVYELMAAKIFNVDLKDVTGAERFVGKQAILGCLAEGTLVLTNFGWKHIEKIETTDKLWDGIEWVDHKGLIFQGMKKNIERVRALVDSRSRDLVRKPLDGNPSGAPRKYPFPSIGQRSGKLTVTGFVKGPRGGCSAVVVQCDCNKQEYGVLFHNFKRFMSTRCPKCAHERRGEVQKNYWKYAEVVPR
jgi:DNA polymerase bacteriophage-type